MSARRLVDMNPGWVGAGGEGVFKRGANGELIPIPQREGVGVMLDCPCGCATGLYVPFTNPLDGGPPHDPSRPTWDRTGDTFETLTTTPSVLRVNPESYNCGGWHGYITAGEIITCA